MRRSIAVFVSMTSLAFALAVITRQEHVAGHLPDAGVAHAQELRALPIAFEPNVGQADSRVLFLSRAGGSSISLTATGAVLSLPAPSTGGAGGSVLRLRFVGADPAVRAIGEDRSGGVSNYFLGDDPARWRTGVPHFGRVTYRDLYPGVNLTFYGNREGQLEYDFEVAPGGDPSRIRLAFDGMQGLSLDASGDLTLRTREGTITEPRPLLYQVAARARGPVQGSFVVHGSTVGFSVGARDLSRPLIIDPKVVYSSYIGGTGNDWDLQETIATDASGDVYRCGGTDSVDFPVTPGAAQPVLAGSHDTVLLKLNRGGTALVYATYLGGSGFDGAFGCAIDRMGHAYVVGRTQSTDFPTTAGTVQGSFAGGGDCENPGVPDAPCDGFVAKFSGDGSRLIYSTYLGGTGFDETATVKADAAGNAYVTGCTDSQDFPVTAKAYQPQIAGGHDYYVAKLNPKGSALVFSTYLGGSDDECFDPGIGVDAHANVYVSSGTPSLDFPTTPGAFQTSLAGPIDAFITKLNPTGSALVYSTYLGGSDYDFTGSSLVVDPRGRVYVDGVTSSTDFPTTPGSFQQSFVGGDGAFCGIPCDAFIVEMGSAGSALIHSTYLGGTGDEFGAGIARGDRGQVFEMTLTMSSDFPVTDDAFQSTSAGGVDQTITELTPQLSGVVWSTYLGGSADEFAGGLGLDPSGDLFVPSDTNSADFPVTPGAFQTTFEGGDDTGWCSGCDLAVVKIAFGNDLGAARAVHRGPARASSLELNRAPLLLRLNGRGAPR
jgi:hypothetical protein